MTRWIGGIVAAIISGVAVAFILAALDPERDDPDDPRTAPTSGPPAAEVHEQGFRTETRSDIPASPDSNVYSTFPIDLDSGSLEQNTDADLNIDLDHGAAQTWLRARIGAEAGSDPSYEDCVAALAGAGEYSQDGWGPQTICVRTDEGRISRVVVLEGSAFEQNLDPNWHQASVTYEFTTWEG